MCKKQGRTRCLQCNKRVFCSVNCRKKGSPEHNEICKKEEGSERAMTALENCSNMLNQLGLGVRAIPDFHLEYAARSKIDRKHIEKLITVHKEFTVLSVVNSNTTAMARGLEEEGNRDEIFFQPEVRLKI